MGLNGALTGSTTSPSGAGGSSRSTCSASVSPVQVSAEPSSAPAASSSRTTTRDAADRVDVDHRVLAERPHVDEHREPVRELVELLLAQDVVPEVEAGGAGDLGPVEHDVGGAAHRHHHDEGVAHRTQG